jgi:hypothetical protein
LSAAAGQIELVGICVNSDRNSESSNVAFDGDVETAFFKHSSLGN